MPTKVTATSETRAVPPFGTRCQEAGPLSLKFYVPCGAPAEFVVKSNDPDPYAMCTLCADHNVRNRSARYIMEGEDYRLATIEPQTVTDRIPTRPNTQELPGSIGAALDRAAEREHGDDLPDP